MLCVSEPFGVAVTQAEFAGRLADARALSWQAATDDYEACIAAHYVARYEESKEGALRWNQQALACAQAVNDGRVEAFYPSLYLNMGRAHENLGDQAAAQHYYILAARSSRRERVVAGVLRPAG